MSSGEQSFHNLYDFFAFATPTKDLQLAKLVQMAFGEKRKRIFVLYERKHKKTSQNFNPEFSFSSTQKSERKENGKRKEKITILLCYSKHVKISFHYVLNAPCAYYAFLISRSKRGKQQPDREDGSEKFCSTEKCYLFLGK